MKMAGGDVSPVRKTGRGPPSPAIDPFFDPRSVRVSVFGIVTDPFIIFFYFIFFSSPVIGLGLGFRLKTDFSFHFESYPIYMLVTCFDTIVVFQGSSRRRSVDDLLLYLG
jgi:hypothetical protein